MGTPFEIFDRLGHRAWEWGTAIGVVLIWWITRRVIRMVRMGKEHESGKATEETEGSDETIERPRRRLPLS